MKIRPHGLVLELSRTTNIYLYKMIDLLCFDPNEIEIDPRDRDQGGAKLQSAAQRIARPVICIVRVVMSLNLVWCRGVPDFCGVRRA